MTAPRWGDDHDAVRASWPLDPTVAHLNHGSFGAVATTVLDEQDRWRDRMRANPTGFFWRELPGGLEAARLEVAAFLRADGGAVALIDNATAGVQAALRAVPLEPGDEVVVTDHAYGAVRLAVRDRCAEVGARVIVAGVPFPPDSDEEVVEAVLGAVTDRTRLAVIDHIASPTALVFPVERLVPALRERGVVAFVDAAHAPGQVAVDVGALGADLWVGNLHKWVGAPPGAAALAVSESWRTRIRPPVTSWYVDDPYPASLRWLGTGDRTALLAIPAALAFLRDIGLERLWRYQRELAAWGQARVADAVGDDPVGAPAAAMRVVRLPPEVEVSDEPGGGIVGRIADELGVEVAVNRWRGQALLRLSAHAYVTTEDIERLAGGLPRLLA